MRRSIALITPPTSYKLRENEVRYKKESEYWHVGISEMDSFPSNFSHSFGYCLAFCQFRIGSINADYVYGVAKLYL